MLPKCDDINKNKEHGYKWKENFQIFQEANCNSVLEMVIKKRFF